MFTACQLSKDMDIDDGWLSPVSQAVGRSMRVFRPKGSTIFGKDRFYLHNRPATSMMRTADPASPWFRFAPMDWQDNTGTILVARRDRQPLEPHDEAAMADFCTNHMGQNFQDVAEGIIPKEETMAKMSPAAYNVYKAAYVYRPDHPEDFE